MSTLTKKFKYVGFFASILLLLTNCKTGNAPEWDKTNNDLIKQYNLSIRQISGLPAPTLLSNLAPGMVTGLDSIASMTLYPGVTGKIFWGSGTMVSSLQLEPNAEIPEEVLPADRFLIVLEGSVNQLISGTSVTMISIKREEPDGIHSGTPRNDFVYLEKGSKNGLTAGPGGAKILEVYSPLRLDYLQKAGLKDLPAEMEGLAATQEPNVQPNKVYDLYAIQFSEIVSGTYTRLLTGKSTQLSFITMDPGSVFPHHIHPEEQMMFVLRGGCNEIILDGEQLMKVNDVVRIPANMVHGANIGELGCDALDIFWPARTDYLEKHKAALAAYHAIIPEGNSPELIIDGSKTKPGLTFSEGPKWMNGKIYFSNMFFDQNFNASPKKSSTVEMDTDGSYRYITQGKMQTNGLYPYKNGNLIVCDMMGHRVVEMTTNGEVVKVLADKYN
jgi:gluconolactonase